MVKHSRRTDGHNEVRTFYNAFLHKLIIANLIKSKHIEVLYGIGYHCHLLVELILKACLLHQDDKYPNSHEITTLAEKINFLNLNNDDKKLLKRIEEMYKFRYPFPLPQDENKKEFFFDLIREHRAYCLKAILLLDKIWHQMPIDLKKTYKIIFSRKPSILKKKSQIT